MNILELSNDLLKFLKEFIAKHNITNFSSDSFYNYLNKTLALNLNSNCFDLNEIILLNLNYNFKLGNKEEKKILFETESFHYLSLFFLKEAANNIFDNDLLFYLNDNCVKIISDLLLLTFGDFIEPNQIKDNPYILIYSRDYSKTKFL